MSDKSAKNLSNLETRFENHIKILKEENSALKERYKELVIFDTTIFAIQNVMKQFDLTLLELNSEYQKKMSELQRCRDEEIESILVTRELQDQTRKRKFPETEPNNLMVQSTVISLNQQENFFSSKYLEHLNHQEECDDEDTEISYLQNLDNENQDVSANQKPFKDVTNLNSLIPTPAKFIRTENPKSESSIKRRKLFNYSDDAQTFDL